MDQHGISIADYSRCKRANKVACPDCKKAASEYVRARRDLDRDKDREQRRLQRINNPEARRSGEKRYREKYPELQRAKERRKRARLKNVPSVRFLTKDVLDLWGTDCHICLEPIDMRITRHCGEEGWEKGLHLDHVTPLAKGGHDVISNVKPTHAQCNLKKSAKLFEATA